MNFSKNLLTLFLVFSSAFAFSQANYQKGLIVNIKGDTVRGYIDLKEWGNNPREINFKTSLDKSSPQVLSVADINYFQVTKIIAYRRFTTSISLDQTNLQKLRADRDTSSKIDNVFLKEQQKGKYVALYSYQDDLKERFYIYDNQTHSVAELIYRIYYVPNEKNNVTTSSQEAYKQQLLLSAQKFDTYNSNIRALIENAEYVRSDLEFVCRKINDSKQEEKLSSSKKYFRPFVGVGFDYNMIHMTGSFPLFDYTPSHSSSSPAFFAGLSFYPVPDVGRSIIKLEVSYYSDNFSTTGHAYFQDTQNKSTYTFQQRTFSIVPQFEYNIYNTDPFKFYMGAGVSFNTSTYSGDSYVNPVIHETVTDFGLSHRWYSVPIKAGIVLQKKLDISVTYIYPQSVSDNIAGTHQDYNYSFNLQTFRFGLGYQF